MRIEDISPREDTMIRSLGRDLQSISGKGLCVAVSADGARAYLGGHSGVAGAELIGTYQKGDR